MYDSVFSTPKSSSTVGKFLQKIKLSDGTVKTYVYLREAQPSGKLLNSILQLTAVCSRHFSLEKFWKVGCICLMTLLPDPH